MRLYYPVWFRLGRLRVRGRVAQPVQISFVFEAQQALVERGCTALAEHPSGEALEFVGEFAPFEHAALGAPFEAAAVGKRDRDRAWLFALNQPDPPAQRADLRIGKRRFVPGFRVARFT